MVKEAWGIPKWSVWGALFLFLLYKNTSSKAAVFLLLCDLTKYSHGGINYIKLYKFWRTCSAISFTAESASKQVGRISSGGSKNP